MIIKHDEIASNLAGFESQTYSIKAGGKGFKILIDSIYTNKERAAIREIFSNAYDAHVVNGNEDEPFDCHVPTEEEPWFECRDYGVSMNHDECMHLYTTVFESPKETTNELVGAWGLGSKAFFAYTDSASITAYLDGIERLYIASIAEGGIPLLTFVSAEATSERNGISVRFPVRADSIDVFQSEIRGLSRGFDVPPNCGDFEIPERKPFFSGKGWKIYAGDHAVRQGCVVYPVTSGQMQLNTPLAYGYGILIDVPIGTVEVAANREALQLTPETTAIVKKLIEEAGKVAKTRLLDSVSIAPDHLTALRKYYKHKKLFMSLTPYWNGDKLDDNIRLNEGLPAGMDKIHMTGLKDHIVNAIPFWSMNSMHWVIDRGEKVIRRITRLKALDRFVVFHDPTVAQYERIKAMLGLTDDNFIKITEIPDPGPKASTGSGGGGTKSGVYNLHLQKLEPSAVEDDFYWLPVTKPFKSAPAESLCFQGVFQASHLVALTRTMQKLNPLDRPVYLLAPYGVKKVTPDTKDRFDTILRDALLANKAKILKEAWTEGFNTGCYNSQRKKWLWLAAGLSPVAYNHNWYVDRFAKELFSKEINEAYQDGAAHLQAIVKQFPVLFGDPSEEQVAQYIDFIKNPPKKTPSFVNLPIHKITLNPAEATHA